MMIKQRRKICQILNSTMGITTHTISKTTILTDSSLTAISPMAIILTDSSSLTDSKIRALRILSMLRSMLSRLQAATVREAA